jgi:AcrR family transcriptional regulator
MIVDLMRERGEERACMGGQPKSGEVESTASQSKRASRYDLILEAAEIEFYERSFDGVGVAAIGLRAGITPSAIYRHFESKDEILATLFDRAIDALQAHTAHRFDDPFEQLEYLVRGHVEFSLSEHRLNAVWTREQHALAEPYRRRVHRRQKSYIDRWIACLDACYPGNKAPDITAVVRVAHAIITSDGTRPPAVPRSANLKTILVAATLRAMRALDRTADRSH